MAGIKVRLGERSYSVHVGAGIIRDTPRLISALARGKRIAVITNRKVYGLYGRGIISSLNKAGFDALPLLIPDGEKYKTLATIEKIYDRLVDAGFDRMDTVLALGGGVTGDMAGFAAATYMRGIPYIQVPTTLLAQVDSSVGGKTAVDHPRGKNMIGAFYQPKTVICDIATLKTLSQREFRCGLAEVVKYGIIRSSRFFDYLEGSVKSILARENDSLAKIVKDSCKIKARVVEEDEKEGGIRAILNYGHTFAHGIETALGYKKLKHGEAVAIGMVMAARLSYAAGFSSSAVTRRIERILRAFGLPVKMPKGVEVKEVLEGMMHDKKVHSGRRRLVLCKSIGRVFICEDLPEREIANAMRVQI